MATLPGAWHYRVIARIGWPSVSTLWLGEAESFICNFYLSVAACRIEQICPWDTQAYCWDMKQPTDNQQPTNQPRPHHTVASGEACTWSARDLGIEPYFPWSNHTSDLNIGTLVATVSLAWWLRCPPRERKIQGSIPACAVGIFPGHTSVLKISTPVASLGAWRYRVSVGTGLPSVSMLRLGEITSLMRKFYLSVAACTIVWTDLLLRYTNMLLGHETNQQTTTNQSTNPILTTSVA